MIGMPSQPVPVLEARNLVVNRRGDVASLRVLDGLDLSIAGGTLTDVVGQSGAGKTTLLLALARLLPGVEGSLALRGEPASTIDPRIWRVRVAYLPQRSALLPGTVGENLTLPWRLKVRAAGERPTDEALRAALDRVHLADIALDRDVSRLSEGQAARVALLRTVLTRPALLLLDEPDAALDDKSAEQVGLLTREFVDAGGAVVRVRHLRSDGHAERRLRLRDGVLTEETS
jgi:putative ABC transport system ATP-binding protein